MTTPKGLRLRAPNFPCPICNEPGRVRKNEEMSHITRRMVFQCDNVDCGQTWEAHLSFVRTISPSALGPVKTTGRYVRKPPDPLTRPLTTTRKPAA